MKFKYVSGRRCLDFAGTLKFRSSLEPEELLTRPQRLSDWAIQAGFMDAATEISDDEVAGAVALREAIYRIVIARIEGRRLKAADIDLVNEHASQPRLAPRLRPNGSITRQGTAPQLLATLAADLLDLVSGPDIEKVKRCSHPGCTRLYIDTSRAQNRHWCGMSTCGNKAKVAAFRARQRASASS
ncbi:CGNR zinc finger domain-containing protein [Mycobacterium sp.]|uniref:CGNR zinc finger domain-containing protein n=1 Tax=Mycobacterium sp. TaxID=1785 RepID=UPI003C751213